ncbi:MAG: ComEA family DNA-binding protein [Woeseiaceae bacterium]
MKTLRIILTCLAFSFSSFLYASPVDINTADALTLSKNIKGVGIKKAQAIIAYREQHGAFKTVIDLKKVKGIGPRLLEKNDGIIKVNN